MRFMARVFSVSTSYYLSELSFISHGNFTITRRSCDLELLSTMVTLLEQEIEGIEGPRFLLEPPLFIWECTELKGMRERANIF